MVEEGEDWKDVNIPVETVAAPAAAPSAPKGSPAVVPATSSTASGTMRTKLHLLGPAVKLLLHQHGLDAFQVFLSSTPVKKIGRVLLWLTYWLRPMYGNIAVLVFK